MGLGFRVDGFGFSLGFRVLNVRFTSHGSKDYVGTLQCSRSIRSIDVAVAASATADAVKDLVPGLTAARWQSVYSCPGLHRRVTPGRWLPSATWEFSLSNMNGLRAV